MLGHLSSGIVQQGFLRADNSLGGEDKCEVLEGWQLQEFPPTEHISLPSESICLCDPFPWTVSHQFFPSGHF